MCYLHMPFQLFSILFIFSFSINIKLYKNMFSSLPEMMNVLEIFFCILQKSPALPPALPYLLQFPLQLPEESQLHYNGFYIFLLQLHLSCHTQSFCPCKISFPFLFLSLEMSFPSFKIIPKYTCFMFTALLNYFSLKA